MRPRGSRLGRSRSGPGRTGERRFQGVGLVPGGDVLVALAQALSDLAAEPPDRSQAPVRRGVGEALHPGGYQPESRALVRTHPLGPVDDLRVVFVQLLGELEPELDPGREEEEVTEIHARSLLVAAGGAERGSRTRSVVTAADAIRAAARRCLSLREPLPDPGDGGRRRRPRVEIERDGGTARLGSPKMTVPRAVPRPLCKGLIVILSGSACMSSSLPPEAKSLEDALPSSATVAVYRDKGRWGDVVGVLDSDESMAAGPTPGATFSATQAWLAENTQSLQDAGFDYLLQCNSAVNIDPSSGEVTSRLSEMVPLELGGSITSVKTGQKADSGNSTTISCEG
jgi:hypothetical protein